jgi:hypothetical protein
MLAQRQFYTGHPCDAMITAMRLKLYEDVLGTDDVCSLIALASFHAGYYEQTSNAFLKLETHESVDAGRRRAVHLDHAVKTLLCSLTLLSGLQPPRLPYPYSTRCGLWTPSQKCRAAACGTEASRSRARAATRMSCGRGCQPAQTAAASRDFLAVLQQQTCLYCFVTVADRYKPSVASGAIPCRMVTTRFELRSHAL